MPPTPGAGGGGAGRSGPSCGGSIAQASSKAVASKAKEAVRMAQASRPAAPRAQTWTLAARGESRGNDVVTGAQDRTLQAMAMGKRKSEQAPMWMATTELPVSPGHPFYVRLNAILDAAGFDRFVEEQCRPFYAPVMGRPSLAPGRYFRLLLVGYFEGLDSERGI